MAERQLERLKKLEDLASEIRRLPAFMTVKKYQKKRFRRLAAQQLDVLRIKRDALRLPLERPCTNRLCLQEVEKHMFALWPISKGQPSPQDEFIPKPQPTVLSSIGYSDHPFFYCVVVDFTSGKYETTAFGDPSFRYNSTVEPIFAAQSDDCSFIITGDLLGSVGIYDWYTPQTSSSVVPARRFEAHEDGAVTALAWSSVVLATGSVRGTATIWDALTL
ncbi:hypothetical protein EV702DRAFT_1196460 [Suillus placidus]|uniref:Uncharacterized protein n=1 Tax=Suillus placidus TaxID=48579 RepID=A0A9P7D3S7_9AGAM|nr:hypothetical protein EV702DRAFT_1196460 [Suillus placidus]